jgi:hypothetical protein
MRKRRRRRMKRRRRWWSVSVAFLSMGRRESTRDLPPSA